MTNLFWNILKPKVRALTAGETGIFQAYNGGTPPSDKPETMFQIEIYLDLGFFTLPILLPAVTTQYPKPPAFVIGEYFHVLYGSTSHIPIELNNNKFSKISEGEKFIANTLVQTYHYKMVDS